MFLYVYCSRSFDHIVIGGTRLQWAVSVHGKLEAIIIETDVWEFRADVVTMFRGKSPSNDLKECGDHLHKSCT